MDARARAACLRRIGDRLRGFDDALLAQIDAALGDAADDGAGADALGGDARHAASAAEAAGVARDAAGDSGRVDAAWPRPAAAVPPSAGALSRRQAVGGGLGLAVLALATARWLAGACDAAPDQAAGDGDGGDQGAAAGGGAGPLAPLAAPIAAVVAAAKALAAGLAAADAQLAAAEGALPPLRDGAARVETLLPQLEAAVADLVAAAGAAPPADARARADAVGAALADLVARRPFGRDAAAAGELEAVRRVVVLVPALLDAVGTAFIDPLRAAWLPAAGQGAAADGGLAALFDTLHRRVLEPGRTVAAAAGDLAAAWRAVDAAAGDGAAAPGGAP